MTLESRCGDFNPVLNNETEFYKNKKDVGEIIVVVNENVDYTQQNNEEVINITTQEQGKNGLNLS